MHPMVLFIWTPSDSPKRGGGERIGQRNIINRGTEELSEQSQPMFVGGGGVGGTRACEPKDGGEKNGHIFKFLHLFSGGSLVCLQRGVFC